jgi:uncharacterized protein YbdZ (MbtH family)
MIGYLGLFLWLGFHDDTPHFFPLNNPNGEYMVTKNCPGGQGWKEQVEDKGKAYCIEYKGKEVFLNKESGSTNFFRITVGKSMTDLQPYLNKKVKNIQGEYKSSSKQCIQQKCIDISGPLVVLDIDHLELAQ